jgi:hypothetical protein
MKNKIQFKCFYEPQKEEKEDLGLYHYIPTDTTLSLDFKCDDKALQEFIDINELNDKINLVTYNPITKQKEVRLCKYKPCLKIVNKRKCKRWIKKYKKANSIIFKEIIE